jgi:outer membrane protein assembly factor BamA
MERAIVKYRSIIVAILLLPGGNLIGQAAGGEVPIVRSILVEGNETTKEFVILREMSTRPGDTLNFNRLTYDESRIYSLGLFNRVEIEHMIDGNAADLVVRVHERWYLYPFPVLGFKYRDFDNFYYGFGIAHTNFRGRNEKLIFEFALGFDRWIRLIYQTPKLTDGDDVYFRISLSSARVQNLNPDRGLYQQRTQSVLLTLGKRFGLYSLLQASAGYELWKVSDEISGGTLTPGGRDAFFSASLNFTYDTRDIREYPTQGTLFQINTMKYGFGESVVDFFRYGADASRYTLLPSAITLATRVHGQFTAGGPVPAYRYVYFGYRERIRGYYNRVLEGENLIGANLELRIPLLSPRYYEFTASPLPEFSLWRYGIYAGIFADAGRIWYRDEGMGVRHW